MEIGIIYHACGGPVVFDNLSIAVAFVQMLAHQIGVEQFLDVVRHAAPGLMDTAKEVVTACMGTGA